MNQRLQQFLTAENLSQSQFADILGVARGSVSHILSGRNKPGYEFLESMMQHYPALNMEWLFTGKGKMYKTARTEPSIADNAILAWHDNSDPGDYPDTDFLFPEEDIPSNIPSTPLSPAASKSKAQLKVNTANNSNNQRVISKITVFYSDGTYEELVKE